MRSFKYRLYSPGSNEGNPDDLFLDVEYYEDYQRNFKWSPSAPFVRQYDMDYFLGLCVFLFDIESCPIIKRRKVVRIRQTESKALRKLEKTKR